MEYKVYLSLLSFIDFRFVLYESKSNLYCMMVVWKRLKEVSSLKDSPCCGGQYDGAETVLAHFQA